MPGQPQKFLRLCNGQFNSVSNIIRCVLLDIEGTVAPIAFVTDVMFPYIRKHVAAYLRSNWNADGLSDLAATIGEEALATSDEREQFGSNITAAQSMTIAWVSRLMDRDAKTTALKQLQGQIWKAGFESGQLVAQLYPEVHSVLAKWRERAMDLRIYSSGSIAAQRLFFGHTQAGNLLDWFSAFYDTTIGGKKEIASYQRIAADIGCAASEVLFCSDVVDELDAAAGAGMQTALSLRPGNPLQPLANHASFKQLGEVAI